MRGRILRVPSGVDMTSMPDAMPVIGQNHKREQWVFMAMAHCSLSLVTESSCKAGKLHASSQQKATHLGQF